MNREALINKLADSIVGRAKHPLGIAGSMIEDQIALGRTVMQVGSAWPFEIPEQDWVFPVVVSHDGREAFIVAILAKNPGSGAFRRLIDSVCAAGLVPVVCAPVGVVMPAILKRWGWRETVIGTGFDAVDEWRPA